MLVGTALMLLALQTQPPAVGQPTADGRSAPLHPRVAPPTDSTAVALRAAVAPVIDGRADDAVWRDAPPITAFRDWRPTEDKPARFRTEAKVADDAADLYLFVPAFDPHPDRPLKI